MNSLKTMVLFGLMAGTFAVVQPADAARRKFNKNLNFTSCPWQGAPSFEKIGGGVILVANTKFKIGRPKHVFAFRSLLTLCNADHVLPAFTAWQQAQALVTAKAAAAAAYASSAGIRAATTEDAAERQNIAKEAAEKAAQYAAELIPLTADAKAKKLVFQAEFMATSNP